MTLPYPYQKLKCVSEDDKHWWLLCPYHDETNPSFSINKTDPFKHYYRCWSCGRNGSAKKWARLTNQDEFPISETKTKQETVRPKVDWKKYLVYQVGLSPLARKLGVSVQTIEKFGICYDVASRCWLIPMYDENGICGIQTRDKDGKKRCKKHSKHGWFCPAIMYKGNPVFYRPTFNECPLYITEGFSDTAVLIELKLWAIGRFNALHTITPPMFNINDREIIIVSDTDKVGIDGSKKLQKLIPNSRILIPAGYKDLRELYLDRGKEFTKCWLKGEIYL